MIICATPLRKFIRAVSSLALFATASATPLVLFATGSAAAAAQVIKLDSRVHLEP